MLRSHSCLSGHTRSCVFPCMWLLLLVLLLSAHTAFSSAFRNPEEWRWLRFSTENGLPSAELHSLCETPTGTVWIATESGLAWYNGFLWQQFDSSRGIPKVPVSTVFPLGRDSVVALVQGRLYAGTEKGFRALLTGLQPILAAVVCGSDSIFFITSRNGAPDKLFLYRNGRSRLVPLPAPLHIAFMAPERENYGLFCTRNNRLWLNTKSGLYRLDPSATETPLWQMVHRHSSFSPVSAVVEDSNGNGFFFLPFGSQQGFWSFTSSGSSSYTGVGKGLALMSADIAPNGTISAVYSNGVASSYQSGQWDITTSDQTETIGATLIAYRRNGDMWLHTRSTLSLYRSSLARWQYITNGSDVANNHVNEILYARNGDVWVATANGVWRSKPDKSIESFTSILGQKLDNITALAEDREGHVWIGSGSAFSGAYRWNGSSWRRVAAAEGLRAERIHKIRKDRQGRLWFLSLSAASLPTGGGDGAFVYDKGKFVHWGTQQGLPSGRVYSFVEDKQGRLWFGTLAGLSRYDQGTWKHWPSTTGWVDKLFALAVDSTNRVWFSRFQKGIGYVQNDSLHSVPLSSSFGSFNGHNVIAVDLQVDSRNRVWIATQGSGLYCYNNGYLSNVNLGMGLSSMNIWPLVVADNRLYIGTIGRGVNVLSMNEQSTMPPIVVFSPLAVKDNAAEVRWTPHAFWGHLSSSEIQTRYRLDNGEWSQWSSHHSVVFYEPKFGNHTVTVEVKDMFASVNKQQFAATFSIPVPFYVNPWFLFPLSSLLALTVMLAVSVVVRKRRYTMQLQSLNAELEHRIRERTAALLSTNTHLRSEITHRQQVEEELRRALLKEKELNELKSRFVGMVSHEFRTPLSAILASADVLDRYYERLHSDEKVKYYNRIRDSVARITALMEDVLFIGNADSGKLTLFSTRLDLDDFCQGILAALPPEQTERIHYSFEGTKEAVLDSKLLRLILLNLLSNAFTYSAPTAFVRLRVVNTEQESHFTIADQGIGIPSEDMEHIFDTFHRGTNIGTIPGSGLGLSIVKECVDMHQGTVSIRNTNPGTEVDVLLPVTKHAQLVIG